MPKKTRILGREIDVVDVVSATLNFVPLWQRDLELTPEFQALTFEEQQTVIDFEKRLHDAEDLDRFVSGFRPDSSPEAQKEAIKLFKELQKVSR